MAEASFPIEFIGGIRNEEAMISTNAPPFYDVKIGADAIEIYERQNNEPPFIYVQIGYAGNETRK